MKKIVVDVALLLPQELERKIIELNNSLKRNYKNIRINHNKDCHPHISLFMGFIDYEQINDIKKDLEKISQSFEPQYLEIEKLDIENLPVKNGEIKISGFELTGRNSLRKLHEEVVNKIKDYIIDENITKEYLFNSKEIDEEDTPWMFPYVENFIQNSSYENFKAHITLGDGVLEKELKLPINFTTSRLAICYLGNYCTCRNILYETKLKEN